ncbi:MAG: prefoldin subunit beta [Thermoplasmataceae archaeon]|jgi:prefoldin beta subunit
MEPNLGSYLQNQIKQAQQIELQMEQTASQKYQLEIKVKELEKTLKELSEIPDGSDIYKNTGVVMYKVLEKKKLIDELEEQKELSEIRIKTYERQQKSLEDKYKEIEESLRKSYEQQQKK